MELRTGIENYTIKNLQAELKQISGLRNNFELNVKITHKFQHGNCILNSNGKNAYFLIFII